MRVEVEHLMFGLILDGSYIEIHNHFFIVEGGNLISILLRVSVAVAVSAEASLHFDILVSLEFSVILPSIGDVMTSNEVTSRNSLLATSLVSRSDDLHFYSCALGERVLVTVVISPFCVFMTSIIFFVVDTLVLIKVSLIELFLHLLYLILNSSFHIFLERVLSKRGIGIRFSSSISRGRS